MAYNIAWFYRVAIYFHTYPSLAQRLTAHLSGTIIQHQLFNDNYGCLS